MAKKSKEVVLLEKMESKKTTVKNELIGIIRSYDKNGDRFLTQAVNKEAKMNSMIKRGLPPEAIENETLLQEATELREKAQVSAIASGKKLEKYLEGVKKEFTKAEEAQKKLLSSGKSKVSKEREIDFKVQSLGYKLQEGNKIAEKAKHGELPKHVQTLGGRIWRSRLMYIMMIPTFIASLMFSYWPMYGTLLAFKDYDIRKGILGSPLTKMGGFGHFYDLFHSSYFVLVLRNTLIISISKLIINTLFVIIFALLLNEVKNNLFRRTVQAITYLPHFLSWVIMASLLMSILSMSGGAVNKFIEMNLGGKPVNFLAEPKYFRALLYITEVWKEGGWGSIIYLAAILGINPVLYESALIDGAGRFKQAIYVTLPSIRGTIVILLVMGSSSILNAGMEQIMLLQTPATMNVSDVIDTYMFRLAFSQQKFDIATAVELSKSIVGFCLLIATDKLSKLFGEEGLL